MHQDASIDAATVGMGDSIARLEILRGTADVNGDRLSPGDGAGGEKRMKFRFKGRRQSQKNYYWTWPNAFYCNSFEATHRSLASSYIRTKQSSGIVQEGKSGRGPETND